MSQLVREITPHNPSRGSFKRTVHYDCPTCGESRLIHISNLRMDMTFFEGWRGPNPCPVCSHETSWRVYLGGPRVIIEVEEGSP